jgi:hypothetical protein
LFAGYIHLLLPGVMGLLDHHLLVLLQLLYQRLFLTVGLGIRNRNSAYEILLLRHRSYRCHNQDNDRPSELVVVLVDSYVVDAVVGTHSVLGLVGAVAVQQELVGLLYLPTNYSS